MLLGKNMMDKILLATHWQMKFCMTALAGHSAKKSFNENVKQILILNNINKLKEFVIRLYLNNLFLNNRAHHLNKDNNQKCWACNEDIESHAHLFGTCMCTTTLFDFL